MRTSYVNKTIDGITVVGASNAENDYILWQFDGDGPIHFEWNDQKNSGLDIVSEITLDQNGCHLVVAGEIVSIYWSPPRGEGIAELANGLRELYPGRNSILVVHDL